MFGCPLCTPAPKDRRQSHPKHVLLPLMHINSRHEIVYLWSLCMLFADAQGAKHWNAPTGLQLSRNMRSCESYSTVAEKVATPKLQFDM